MRRRGIRRSAGTFAFLVLFVHSGCASVDPKPFEEFRDGSMLLRGGTSVLLATDLEWTREGFVSWVAESPSRLADYQLALPEKGKITADFAKDPTYLPFLRASRAFSKLNDQFVRYAMLLADLSGGKLLSVETFDALAADMKGNLDDAAKELVAQQNPIPGDADEAKKTAITSKRQDELAVYSQAGGILSAAASSAFRAYLEHQRRDDLHDAVVSAQTEIALYSKLAVDSLDRMYYDFDAEYRRQWRDLSKEVGKATTPATKRRYVSKAISLTETTRDVMATAASLSASYAKLPSAHADLAVALEKDSLSLTGLRAFYDQARHTYDLYKTLIEPKQIAGSEK